MEFNSGYIKLSRNILKNEFLMHDEKAFSTFIKILLVLDRKTGTLKTGRRKLSALTGYEGNTVYKVIKRLEKQGIIKINSSKTDTTIIVCNWEKWQKDSKNGEQQSNNPGNNPGNNESNNPENYKNETSNNVDNKNGIDSRFAGNTIQEYKNTINNNVPTFSKLERTSKKKYDEIDIRLAEKLFRLMKQNYDHITKNPKESDYVEIRRIHSIDGKSYETIEWIIEWSQRHEFWKDKILSTGKLRKQMDQLMVQAKDERKKKSSSYTIPGSAKTKKDDPILKEAPLTEEQKERGKLIKDLISSGYKMSELMNLKSKSNKELKKLLDDKIK